MYVSDLFGLKRSWGAVELYLEEVRVVVVESLRVVRKGLKITLWEKEAIGPFWVGSFRFSFNSSVLTFLLVHLGLCSFLKRSIFSFTDATSDFDGNKGGSCAGVLHAGSKEIPDVAAERIGQEVDGPWR
jgi:hypothetical protein